jgi:hypothetical protein
VLFDEDINMHHELSKHILYYLVYYTVYTEVLHIMHHIVTRIYYISYCLYTCLSSDHITLRKALLHALQAVENSLQECMYK